MSFRRDTASLGVNTAKSVLTQWGSGGHHCSPVWQQWWQQWWQQPPQQGSQQQCPQSISQQCSQWGWQMQPGNKCRHAACTKWTMRPLCTSHDVNNNNWFSAWPWDSILVSVLHDNLPPPEFALSDSMIFGYYGRSAIYQGKTPKSLSNKNLKRIWSSLN